MRREMSLAVEWANLVCIAVTVAEATTSWSRVCSGEFCHLQVACRFTLSCALCREDRGRLLALLTVV